MTGGVGTWKVMIPRGECAQEPSSRAQALSGEENMAAISARVEMGEAVVFNWNSFGGSQVGVFGNVVGCFKLGKYGG